MWATPRQQGFTRGMRVTSASTSLLPASHGPFAANQAEKKKAQEPRNVIRSFESVSDESRRASLLDSMCLTDDVLNLPVQPDPPPPSVESGELVTNLMRHQLQALKWMLEKENPVLPTARDQSPIQVCSHVGWNLNLLNACPIFFQFWKFCQRDKVPSWVLISCS
jgi:SWI/SNF-related matrix-associated actin-dependent regulator of chromatin subfamily A3